jgi:hypothetical protein
VVRYPLSDLGATVSSVGPESLSLTVTNEGGLQTVSPATGSGWRFTAAGAGDRACAPVSGSMLESLNGSTTGSIEVVVDIRSGVDSRSRLIDIGDNGDWSFSLGYSQIDTSIVFSFDQSGIDFGVWLDDLSTRGRAVLTAVFDSSEASADNRIALYIDGDRQGAPMRAQDIGLNQPIAFGGTEQLCIGNRNIGARTPDGDILYAAYYASALTPAEVAQNAEALLAFDD